LIFRWSFFHSRNLLQTGFACRDSGLRLARHPAPGNPVSTGSIAIFNQRVRASIIAQWAPWEVAAVVAIFSLGTKSLRPNERGVNTKPSQK
jgi:hypothetical protein